MSGVVIRTGLKAADARTKVYYIARGWGGDYFRTPDDESWSLTDRLGAERFDTVPEATVALQKYALRGRHFGAADIIRVEETTSAPRRELVTTGDLSLLDKGPVVIQRADADDIYVANDSSRPFALGLDNAIVFKNEDAALRFVEEDFINPGGYTYRFPIRIRPIREIPGEAKVTETVLA